MKHLRDSDEKSFKNFVRVDSLYNKTMDDLGPRLQKRENDFRKPLSTGLKLAITLRYLATGDSYKSLSYGFRVAHNTVAIVVREVCQAIYDHFHETAFKFPTTEEQWKKVAHGFYEQ